MATVLEGEAFAQQETTISTENYEQANNREHGTIRGPPRGGRMRGRGGRGRRRAGRRGYAGCGGGVGRRASAFTNEDPSKGLAHNQSYSRNFL